MRDKLLFFSASLLILCSCSIEKRLHQPGYHVSWNKTSTTNQRSEDKIAAIQENKKEINAVQQESLPVLAASMDEPLDNSIAEPVTSVNTEVLEKQNNIVSAASATVSEVSDKQTSHFQKAKIKSEKKTKKAAMGASGRKYQIIALILCIFFGLIGIHRFYLGYTGLGVLYIFTAGLFGIGWLIDLILLIIPNGLTPKGRTNYKD